MLRACRSSYKLNYHIDYYNFQINAMTVNVFRRSHSSVNLKLLNAFMLVAEHQSFRQAAEASHRSQSAVTTQIKQLESQLGVMLFHRTTRQVALTAEGQLLFESTRRAMAEVELGLRVIQESADLKRGRIFLSCSTTVASTRLAPILAAFENDYPGVEVYVSELASSDMFETVRSESVDFGIGPVVETSEFDFQEILTENLYAIVPKKFLARAGKTIALARLAEMPLLLLSPATALRAMLEDAAREQGVELRTKFQFSQAPTLISMANAGLGVAILPRLVVPETTHSGTHTLLIDSPKLQRTVAVVTLKGRSLSPAATRLIQIVKEGMTG